MGVFATQGDPLGGTDAGPVGIGFVDVVIILVQHHNTAGRCVQVGFQSVRKSGPHHDQRIFGTQEQKTLGQLFVSE
jgi:hypothetical protein